MWGSDGRKLVSRLRGWLLLERGPPPDGVLYLLAGGFGLAGFYVLTHTVEGTLSEYLFFAFVYVGLPIGVVLGVLSLRFSELPPTSWWNVVLGYVTGVAFMVGLVLWASLSTLSSGGSLGQLTDTIVFLANIGGVFGFVAGVNRARASYNRRLQQELRRKNDRLDEFAEVVAHDLRNPLTVARGYLELLAEATDDTEHVRPIRDAIDNMEELINDVLLLARQGKYVDELQEADLGSVARLAWEDIELSNGTVDVRANRTILADETRLKRVFENLYRNSCEHGGDDVTITVGTLEDGFYVEDDGVGIPEDERQKVMEPGYSTADEGTGFGLGIVKAIVEAHDWHITVTASETGGARFEITRVASTSV